MLCAFMAFVQFAAVPEESELKDPFRSERGSLKMMARAVKKRYFFVNKRCTFFSYGRPICDQKKLLQLSFF